MRLFNATSSRLTLPLGTTQLIIPANSVSGNFMATNEFISLLVTSFSTSEVALIVSGRWEYQQIASIPVAVEYSVQSLDEAISRFNKTAPKTEVEKLKEEETKVEETAEPSEVNNEEQEKVSEKLFEEAAEAAVVESPAVEEVVEEPVVEESTKKISKKKSSKK